MGWRKLKEKNLQNGFISEDIPAQIYTKICKQCFGEFVTYDDNQICCNVDCHKKFFDDIRLKSSIVRQRAKERVGACEVCGYNKWFSCLEWHHVCPELKKHEISAMRTYPTEEIEQELKKCVLLCCNCHQEIHRGNLETAGKVLEIIKRKGFDPEKLT